MKIGLAGYSGSGVTTLLSLLAEDPDLMTRHGGPEIRSITVDDPRLERLGAFFNPGKLTPLKLEVLELGDLRPEEGGGLRKDTLARAAGLDAVILVLRGFEAPMAPECRSPVEIAEELESLMQEFAIADLLPVEKRLERLEKEGKIASREAQLLARIQAGLEEGRPIRGMALDPEEVRTLSGYHFLTLSPLMVVAVLGGECPGRISYPQLEERCAREGIAYMETNSMAEWETLELSEEERAPFLADMGLEETTGKRFLRVLFDHLRLVTFYTVGDKEVRAWAVPQGTTALRAAGKVHTDLERGFIRAEVISVDDCLALGGLSGAREAGKLRVEGKTYLVQDGEVFHVRFNV